MKHADYYTRLGLTIVPLNGKIPVVDWKPFQDKKPTMEQIESWKRDYSANGIGGITGPSSGILGLDLDGDTGKQSVAGKDLPDTWAANTPRCGLHYYYQWEPRFSELITTTTALLPGVDTRGEGGLVALPNIEQGRSWLAGHSPDDCPLAKAPEWLIDLLPKRNGQGYAPKSPGWIAESFNGLAKDSHNRNATFTSIAGKLRRENWNPADILGLLIPHADRCQFDRTELKGIIESVSRYPTKGGKGEKQETNTRMESIALADFMAGGEADIDWCVENLLPAEGVGILGGWSGWGKTWLLMDLAIEISRGGRWLDQFQTKAGRVLYIDEEGNERLNRKRLRKLMVGKELEGRPLDIHFSIAQGLCFTNPKSVLALRAKMEELKPSLVIIDALIRVYQGDESSASDMAAVFRVVKAIVRDFKCTILFADHQRKQGNVVGTGDQQLRGSSEKTAFVDTLLSLQKKDESLSIEHSKSRCAEAVPSFAIAIEDDPAKTSTTVKYLGEAAPLKKAAQIAPALEFLRQTVTNEWVSRKDLIEQAKESDVSRNLVDEALRSLFESQELEKDKRKPESGPGGWSVYYRKKNTLAPSNNSSPIPEPIYTGERGTDSNGNPVKEVFTELVRP